MDFDTCNHKKLNQFQAEAQRWKTGDKKPNERSVKKGQKTQPAKRKKKGKK
jgi:hypothetical protein